MIEISGLHHLRISVTNLVRSKEFYSEVIGFEVAAESPGSPEEPAVRNDPAQLYAGPCSSPMACCSGWPAPVRVGGDVGVADSGGLHPSNPLG
jgi:catechol 2,3-dioxygenase-like lactoylglutathione lyase family enzyme